MKKLNYDDVINWGKYKGHTVATFLADTAYCEFLSQQHWFVTKFPELLSAIKTGIDIAGGDICTPEHNEMQLRFLNRNLLLGIVELYALPHIDLSKEGYDPAIGGFNIILKDANATFERQLRNGMYCDVYIEYNYSADICGFVEGTYRTEREEKTINLWSRLSVELKPCISDDFPSILRKSTKSGVDLVMCDKFESAVANFEQVSEMFRRSGVMLKKFDSIPCLRW